MITRFAPSPTGLLHLGHAYSAWTGWSAARRAGGRFRLRIEDQDTARCRRDFEDAILEDLAWLGLRWDGAPLRQSDRLPAHAAALDRLEAMGVLYPCFCSRKEIQAEIAAMASAPHGPDGPLYPGTCRGLDRQARAARIAAGAPYALRLDARAAAGLVGPLDWAERGAGAARGRIPVDARVNGDVVLARKEVATSYHLGVVVDDAFQAVTQVTRGLDLIHATHVHRLLQALLDLPAPEYAHHRLLTDAAGARLAKRADAFAIRHYRERGLDPAEVWSRAGVDWDAASGAPGLDEAPAL